MAARQSSAHATCRLSADSLTSQPMQRKGLIPPDNSPYRDGKVAVNPAVLALQAAWAAGHPSLPPAMYMPLAMQGTSLKPQQ